MSDPTVYTIHGQAIDHERGTIYNSPWCETVTLDADRARKAKADGHTVEVKRG